MSTESSVTLNDVLAQLPEDLSSGAPPEVSVADVLRAAGDAPPIGRFSRFWTLGTLQGKIAAAYAYWWARGMWSSADERQRHLNETHLKAAVKLLGTMSVLRGAVMKLGQVIAHWPGVAPEEFASILGRLYFEAPPMHGALAREQLRAELGAPPEEIFASFESDAFAAASLGQVHRATLKGTGERVAVKIQYPGIARSIRADLANIKLLASPMRLGADGENIMAQLDDIESMLAKEVDYRTEAENMRLARRTLAGLEGVFVPRVHDALSTERVLTMDYVDGVHLDGFVAGNPPQEARDRFGSLIVRSGMRMCYSAHMLYSDPHPGNFVFMHDGRLGLIDFGCVRRYSAAEVDYLTQAERAAFISQDAVREAVIRGADLTERQRTEKDRIDLMAAWYNWVCEPVVRTDAFDFSDPSYMSRGMEIFRELVARRYTRTLPVNTWITKSFVGMRSMLHKLGAHVALGRIMREETSVSLPG